MGRGEEERQTGKGAGKGHRRGENEERSGGREVRRATDGRGGMGVGGGKG